MRDSARNRSKQIPRSTPYRSALVVVFVVVIALILLIADQAGLLGNTRQRLATWLEPLARPLTSIRQQAEDLTNRQTVEELQARVAELEAENSELKSQIIASQALEQENARLRIALDIEQQRGWQLHGAFVSAYTPDEGRRVIMISAGSEDGIEPGMAVIAKEGSSPEALIGVVDAVGPTSSSVLLITDFASTVSAQVYHQGLITHGIIQGRWQIGSRLRLERVERTITLSQGDVVVTAGLTANFSTDLPRAAIPNGIPIGTVEQVETDGYSQSAELQPFVDPDRVRYVWIILSHDE
jgi:rod shape-determining protein MreC